MKHENNKYGKNGAKTLEFLQRQICPKIPFKLELVDWKYMGIYLKY